MKICFFLFQLIERILKHRFSPKSSDDETAVDKNKEAFLAVAYFSTVDLTDNPSPEAGPTDGQELQEVPGGTRFLSPLRDEPGTAVDEREDDSGEMDQLLRKPSAGDGAAAPSPLSLAKVTCFPVSRCSFHEVAVGPNHSSCSLSPTNIRLIG